MLKIAIAEDETSAQTALKEYLDRWQAENGQPVQAVFFESGSQLLENIPQGLQLALLDIQMPGLSGMETAHRLRGTLPELEIVFITSLTGYALESYEVAALDYLVKPVSYPRFCRSLERACRRICQQAENILTIKNNAGVFRLRAKDLVYVEVFSHRLVLHTTAGVVSYSGTLAALEKDLGNGFFRCHSSFLINLEQVTRLDDADVVLGSERLPAQDAACRAGSLLGGGTVMTISLCTFLRAVSYGLLLPFYVCGTELRRSLQRQGLQPVVLVLALTVILQWEP